MVVCLLLQYLQHYTQWRSYLEQMNVVFWIQIFSHSVFISTCGDFVFEYTVTNSQSLSWESLLSSLLCFGVMFYLLTICRNLRDLNNNSIFMPSLYNYWSYVWCSTYNDHYNYSRLLITLKSQTWFCLIFFSDPLIFNNILNRLTFIVECSNMFI